MLVDYKLGQGSIVLRVKLRNSSVTTGAGLTGLTNASTGLIISTIADNESTATAYTQSGSTIETITTLGTYAAPTATKCRFKEVDATNHKGVYELHIADARFAVANAKSLAISISGATNLAECDLLIPLRSVDPYDGVRAGLTALPNATASANGGLPTCDGNNSVLANIVANGKGTATAGTSSTITLQTALGANNYGIGCTILLTGGTGSGQQRVITGYVNSTKVATVDRAWDTTPDSTSVYAIVGISTPALGASAAVATVAGTVAATTTSMSFGILSAVICGKAYYTSASTSPASAGLFVPYSTSLIYNGDFAFQNTSTNYLLWWDSTNSLWTISTNLGARGTNYWTCATRTGTYSAGGSASGSPVLSSKALPDDANFSNASYLSDGSANANLVKILGTMLTETSGYIAAGFKKFFNIATPVATVASVDQTGDSFGRIGVAGAGLTAIGDTRIANLDATVSSRSTYAGGDTSGTTTLLSRVTGAVPLASDYTPTRATKLDNLDAAITTRLAPSGTLATVTNLTTLPTVPTDWLTAAGVSAGAVTKVQSGLATPTNITAATGVVLASVTHTGATIPTTTNVTNTVSANLTQILGTLLTETVAGYLTAGFKKFFNIATPVATVASVDQTGDSFGRIGAAGAGLTNLGDTRIANLDTTVSSRSTYSGGDTAGTTTLMSRVTGVVPLASDYTPTRATKLDNLDAAVTTRLAPSGTLATVTTLTNLPAMPTDWFTAAGLSAAAVAEIQSGLATSGSIPSTSQITAAIWTDLLSTSDFSTAGSVGKLIKDNVDAKISEAGVGSGSSAAITLVSPLSIDGGTLTFTQGDDLYSSDYTAATWSITGTFPSISGATAALDMNIGGVSATVTGLSLSLSGSVLTITAQIPNAKTTSLPQGTGVFQVPVTFGSGHTFTYVQGTLIVIRKV